MNENVTIETYDNNRHREQVTALWKSVFGYVDRRNDPSVALDKKLEIDNRIYVSLIGGRVTGTVMTGYDGHRGWIYSLAVLPEYRKSGTGSRLLAFAEERLASNGCMKINLQILSSNSGVMEFYKKNGYRVEERISMGKQIDTNVPAGE